MPSSPSARSAPAAQANVAQNARLRAIVDVSPFGIAASDNDGYIIESNAAYQRMLGYTGDELSRMRVSDLSDPAVFAENARLFARMVAGELDQYVVEKTYRRRDGSPIWVRVTAVAVRDAAGALEYNVAIAEDITERRRMQQALVDSEERHRTLLEALPLIVYRCDPHPPFRTHYISPAVHVLGITMEEWLRSGSAWIEHIHPEDRDRVLSASAAAKRERRTSVAEYRMLTSDGKTRWFHDVGDYLYDDAGPTAWQGIMLDITERKEAELALRHSEELFRSLTEQTAELMSVLSSDGRFTYVSPTVERLLGWDAAGLTDRGLRELVHREDLAKIESIFACIGAAPGRSVPMTVRVRHSNGGWRVIEGTVTNLLDHPVVRGFVCNARDITDRVSLEEQLRHSQKMDAVGRLAGGIAHDFNNLLTVIIGRAEFMRMSAAEGSEAYRDIDEIRDAAGRAAALTRQLLAYSRKQMLRPRHLRLNDVVDGLWPMLQRLIGEDIELVTRPAGDAASISADPGQLEQVLVNLVVNARDAMPDGGVIVIGTRNETVDPRGEIARKNDGASGAFAVLSVTDTGVGMDRETASRIFEPFFTTKELGQGTGLGLSTVYGIAKQSGGFVTVRSRPGAGTTFELYLPAVADEQADEPGEAAAMTVYRGKETILLAEDSDAVRHLAKRILRGLGYTVLAARDGREALEIASADESRIDLLLTDVVMPHMSGRQLAEAITARRPNIKILYMSGYTDDVIIQKGLRDPTGSFIEKPFTMASLGQRVRQRLDS